MKLSSSALIPDQAIPLRFAETAAGGQNLSPALAWSEVPEGTQSFALTCYDPDAPTGSGWWHWVAIDIPATVTSIEEASSIGTAWANDYGYLGYGGPCPPPGPAHRYIFTVHALDVATLDANPDLTHAAIRFMILAHSLDSASLTATFAIPSSDKSSASDC